MSRVADKISIGISLTLDKTGTVREGRATQYIDELYIRSLQGTADSRCGARGGGPRQKLAGARDLLWHAADGDREFGNVI